MKRFLSITICLFCIFLLGCNQPPTETTNIGDSGYTVTNVPTQTLSSSEREDELAVFDKERYLNRGTWNIELFFLELTEDAILIRICDNDNIGFFYNPLWYRLERLENEEWVKVSRLNEEQPYSERWELAFVRPSEYNSYADTNNLNFFIALSDPEAKIPAGHYRLTKVLSYREFSVEFDIE
ncbi:MAG: hypothetical protein IJW87_00115 [Clostridia bacterium]|nr:hypothetical protein [Clostridia bacterium]